MNAIIKVSLEKVNSTICPKIDKLNGINSVIVTFSNGGLRTFQSLLSEIGNSGFDNWINVEKIKKSTSDKKRFEYVKKFELLLNNAGII